MDLISIVTVVGGVLVPVATLLYIMLRNIRKDRESDKKDYLKELDKLETLQRTQNEKLTLRIEQVENQTTKHDESFKRTHMRSDTIDKKQDKLESSVGRSIEKLSYKFDKMLELLHTQMINK